jgi:hypothetical protein
MAYQSNKPESTDIRSQSQIDIQANFIAIKNLVDVDHGTFGDAKEGKHTQLTIPNTVVSGSLPPLTTATEVMLYAKNEALWFRKHNRPVGDVSQDIDFTTITGTPVKYDFPVVFPNDCYSVQLTANLGAVPAHNQEFLYVVDLKAASFIPICNTSTTVGSGNYVNGREFYYFAIGI